MIKIGFEEIISKIKASTGISEQELRSKIDAKMKQLSDLVSKEGAAHIIANELGIKLFEMSGRLQIKNVLVGMRNVELMGKVNRIFELRTFKSGEREGKLGAFFIGDETGQIRIVAWGPQAEIVNQVKEGDIVKLKGGYVKENQGYKEVHVNERAKFLINPPGETVGEYKKEPAIRKQIKELSDSDVNVEIFGTVVQAFDPRFFEVCPACGKRAKATETGAFMCVAHGNVTPEYSYVMNVVLDDGTDNVRVVCFRNQAEHLTSRTAEQFLAYRIAPETFEQIKNDLLGNQFKVIGRASRNPMFDRMEFISQLVYPADANEEIKRIESVPAETPKSPETHEIADIEPFDEEII